ncbi:MAG: hypothetical protein Q8L28_00215, partial [bacterium]|nr:hypothetical protein [bacterium]
MEKPNPDLTNFEKKMASTTMRAEVKRVEDEFDLAECERSIQFSTFDRGKLKLILEPSEAKFEKIIRKNNPNEIYYKEVN